ncbi:hypothetical protein CC1G_03933 [Coprinopsis cinerea okayama7|uniref:SWIM-type domain-containing protein n=1 Tax=Coprinopsis cinerea (strain Okayama-7 / 130 / ATCC MYA-4618 / FGSC 9003) TaxID=240176 RepID=A8N886_COPC7|nr:hypothetical protein CC1G_03933 [Coprinopsis cinerea okayama7\|eukprot:XP_001831042.2 hypothetical protein CC1G_03933 [Coprinopsis cinerea okayama7\
MPSEAVELIQEYLDFLRPGEMVPRIQATYPEVTANQVHTAWRELSKAHWYRAEQQLESVTILLGESRFHDDIDVFQLSDVPDGVDIVAWGMKKIAGSLEGSIVEIGMDATYNTNSKHLELYSIMAEYDNAGYPLCYCLLTTATAIDQKKRTKSLASFASACKKMYGVEPTFAHLDKDMAEIGCVKEVWPKAKTNICWWHLDRAVSKRLSTNKLQTTPYKLQRQPCSSTDIADYEGGLPEDITPPAVPSALTAGRQPGVGLTIRVPALTQKPPLTQPQATETTAPDTELSPSVKPEGGQQAPPARSSQRIFCPAEHRPKIRRLMEKHYCAHPLIPGESGPTTTEIKRWAVSQMYMYCISNELPEVWAYLWENWYREGRWELWARSVHSQIPVLKTTMILEAHWRRIKRDFLNKFHMPRCDLLAWILVTKLAPTYYRKLARVFTDTGRYRELASWRKDFKKRWRALETRPITQPMNDAYRPDVALWVCTCPSFATSRFLLCKHLIQRVHPVPALFFAEVKRARTTPFWSHSTLIPLASDDIDSEPCDDGQPEPNECNDEEVRSVYSDESDIDEELENFVPMPGGGATFEEAMHEKIKLIRDFADGLEYQIQFRDDRLLHTLERQGAAFLRLALECLEKEKRMRATRGPNPLTWDSSTTNAMFYRSRPNNSRAVDITHQTLFSK